MIPKSVKRFSEKIMLHEQLSRLLCLGNRLDGFEIGVEQRLLLVALLLVLFAHANHFAQDLDIEAVALGFLIDFLLGFGEFLDLLLDVFDALDDRAQLITRNPNRFAHALPLVNKTIQNSCIRARTASERRK